MTGTILIDSNLLVPRSSKVSRSYIAAHKNTRDRFDADDFDLLTLLAKDFAEIVLVPHDVAETSNLVRQIGEPGKREIQRVFDRSVSQTYEIPVASVEGLVRRESIDLGVTDAVLLHLCGVSIGEQPATLLTIDGPLTDRADSLDYRVINYERDFKA